MRHPADSPQAATPAPLLRAALHWRVAPPFATGAPAWLEAVALAGRLAGAQLDQARERSGQQPQAVFLLSTLLPFAVAVPGPGQRALLDGVESRCGLRPQAIVNAYLCAGWGFLLRFLMGQTALRRVALCLVDVDLIGLEWNLEHPVIGRSGFGFSTLLLDLPEGPASAPVCSGPHAHSGFNDLVLALRQHQARHGAVPTFIPFLQQPLAGTAERILAPGSLGANRHAELGHCFGADPWIGVIDWCAARPERKAAEQEVLLGAVAFNGYCSHARLRLGAGLVTDFSCLDGSHAALQAAAARPVSSTAQRTARRALPQPLGALVP